MDAHVIAVRAARACVITSRDEKTVAGKGQTKGIRDIGEELDMEL